MADTKISALTALDSTADLGQLYIPLFKADGSPDNARILAGTMFLCLNVVKNAADRLALRRSTNAQRFEVYRTYTDASTYERGVMSWYDSPPSGSDNGTAGTTFRVGTEKGSVGGTGRDTALIANGVDIIRAFSGTGASIRGGMYTTDGTNAGVALSYETLGTVTAVSNGKIGFTSTATNALGSQDTSLIRSAANIFGITNGSTGGGALEFTEMTAPATPSADKARIFARDNGSGKTQVCIILPDGVVTVLATQT